MPDEELNECRIALQVLGDKLDREVIKLSHISLGELRKSWRQFPTDVSKDVVESCTI